MTEGGEHLNVIQPFGSAEALGGERQVSRDYQYNGILQAGGQLIKPPGRHRTGGRVHTGYNVQHFTFALVGVQRDIFQVAVGQRHRWGRLPNDR